MSLPIVKRWYEFEIKKFDNENTIRTESFAKELTLSQLNERLMKYKRGSGVFLIKYREEKGEWMKYERIKGKSAG